MRVLITGVAGFVGSHLADALLAQGHTVIGIDSFEDYYPRVNKDDNIRSAKSHPNFHLLETNLLTTNLTHLLQDIDCVFHQAAQAGVRASWGQSFEVYVRNNIMATQRLLEAAKGTGIRKLVYASSSSVYGDNALFPLREDASTHPNSPYGVSKLAAEHLCQLYAANFGVPTVSLRYFTVYGPRQRPDMAFHRFARAAVKGEPITLYGSGEQTRDFTFVSDIVKANIAAALSEVTGEVINIGGGSRVSVNHVLQQLESIVDHPVAISREQSHAGDVLHTWADLSKAEALLGYKPTVSLDGGLRSVVDWVREFYG